MNSIPDQTRTLMHALSSLEVKLAKREQQLFEQEKLLRVRDAQIQVLRAEISVLRDQNLAALAEIDQRGVQMRVMREDYESSTSWCVTRPLRWLSQRVIDVKAARADISMPSNEGVPAARQDGGHPMAIASASQDVQSIRATADIAIADRHDYAGWVRRFDTMTDAHREAFAEKARQVRDKSAVTLLSVFASHADSETALIGMQAVLDSLTGQYHANWQWIIVCRPGPQKALKNWAAADTRIRLVEAGADEAVPGRDLNTGLQHATGEWIAWIDNHVCLREHALLVALAHLQTRPEARVLYADEDSMDSQGTRSNPCFRCDANMDLLMASDYMGQLVLFRRKDLVDAGGWNTSLRTASRHELLLRLTEQWPAPAKAITHMPHILSHRLVFAGDVDGHTTPLIPCCAGAKGQTPETRDAVPGIVQAHLSRRGLKGTALPHPTLSEACRIRFSPPAFAPRVGIVIPTRDNVGVLSVCLESLLQRSSYPDFRVVVVDNGSAKPETLAYLRAIDDPRVQVLRDESPFNFSQLINRGVAAVEGDVLCLLNNDMQITQPDWLEEMVGWAMQDGVAAVGARLWYGDGTLQHGGTLLGIHGMAGHAHKFLPKGEPGYLNRAVLHQTISAVTGACMVVRRAVFDEIGGFDETLSVAYNDVDFCLRARRAGYRNVWTPHAEMIHHESISRGFEDSPEKQTRFKHEAGLMRERWGDWLDNDPAYNPNLTLEHEDFGLAWPPRTPSR